MTFIEEEQLKMEIAHIFDSGANELRVLNMIKSFLLKPKENEDVNCLKLKEAATFIHYQFSIMGMEILNKYYDLTVEEFRLLPEVKVLWGAMDLIEKNYLDDK